MRKLLQIPFANDKRRHERKIIYALNANYTLQLLVSRCYKSRNALTAKGSPDPPSPALPTGTGVLLPAGYPGIRIHENNENHHKYLNSHTLRSFWLTSTVSRVIPHFRGQVLEPLAFLFSVERDRRCLSGLVPRPASTDHANEPLDTLIMLTTSLILSRLPLPLSHLVLELQAIRPLAHTGRVVPVHDLLALGAPALLDARQLLSASGLVASLLSAAGGLVDLHLITRDLVHGLVLVADGYIVGLLMRVALEVARALLGGAKGALAFVLDAHCGGLVRRGNAWWAGEMCIWCSGRNRCYKRSR